MGAMVWSTTPEDALLQAYDAWVQRLYTAIYALCRRRAPEIENWLKANAPWTDRTGNARQTLWTEVTGNGQVIVVILSHGMWYGWFLELSNAGRYAVVTPGVDYWTMMLYQDIKVLVQ